MEGLPIIRGDAGFYPEYWEYVMALNAADFRMDWFKHIEYVFPRCYEREFIDYSFVRSLLRS